MRQRAAGRREDPGAGFRPVHQRREQGAPEFVQVVEHGRGSTDCCDAALWHYCGSRAWNSQPAPAAARFSLWLQGLPSYTPAMLRTIAIANYRSLRQLVAPLGALNVVTGANGSGKSN